MLSRLKLKKRPFLRSLLINLLVGTCVICSTLLPFLQEINALFTDQLHGRISPRNEVVILAIDDVSLHEVGAWPWDRSVFAQLVDTLSTAKARVIGIDVLFLEPRSGDPQFLNALEQSKTPVVLASKLVPEENTTLYPIYDLSPDHFGFINFAPDSDGKIRHTYIPSSQEGAQKSFSFQILSHFFPSPSFDKKLSQLKQEYSGSTILFNYTHSDFKTIPVADVIQHKVNPGLFQDKIVLIGTTALDIKSNLSDNLTDVFGQSTPGIVIHANIINSFLQNRFQAPLPFGVFLGLGLSICIILTLLFRLIKSNIFELFISIVVFIVVNLIGLVVFDFGINWPFLTFSLIIICTYFATVVQKYIMENKQRRFIQLAFAQYMNPSLIKKLIDNPDQLKLGGEKREMTVMFSDVRGFTTLSEKIEPEELVSLLNHYLDDMCEVILERKGTIDKFIGDAIMALWNAPLDDPDHQKNALKTAIAMIEQLDKFNAAHEHEKLKIGVGLNTGDMVVGNIGSRRRFDYTVLGDNVNLASRVEGLTKKYGVLVLATESTIRGIDDPEMLFRLVDRVIVKGKSKPIRLYQPMLRNEKNAHLKDTYEKAFAAYEKGDFKTARKIWATLPSDQTSKMMIERLEELKGAKDWKGVWEWHEK